MLSRLLPSHKFSLIHLILVKSFPRAALNEVSLELLPGELLHVKPEGGDLGPQGEQVRLELRGEIESVGRTEVLTSPTETARSSMPVTLASTSVRVMSSEARRGSTTELSLVSRAARWPEGSAQLADSMHWSKPEKEASQEAKHEQTVAKLLLI
jgi:hypothetical protein